MWSSKSVNQLSPPYVFILYIFRKPSPERKLKTREHNTTLLRETISSKMHHTKDVVERKNLVCDCNSSMSHMSIGTSLEAYRKKQAYQPVLVNKDGVSYYKLTSLISTGVCSKHTYSPKRKKSKHDLNLSNKDLLQVSTVKEEEPVSAQLKSLPSEKFNKYITLEEFLKQDSHIKHAKSTEQTKFETKISIDRFALFCLFYRLKRIIGCASPKGVVNQEWANNDSHFDCKYHIFLI